MRACQPSHDGYVERDGVKVFYEVFGSGDPTVMLLPTWSIIHSRHWKLQVPDLARRHRVVTFDGRGNGRSDRPAGAEAYRPAEFTADALAVMDATGTERAVLVALSLGATWALELGALHPERVAGIVFIGPALPLALLSSDRLAHSFTEPLDTDDGWAKFNQHYWREHYREFLEFFFSQCFTEPHSTKPIEDAVGWGLETDPETLIAGGRTRSSTPWMARNGLVIRAHQRSIVSRSGRSARLSTTSVSAVVSSPQPTASSIGLVECGSLKHCPKKNHRKSS